MPNPEPASPQRARVRPQDIAPELALRRMLHAHGLRFALRTRDLPGSPDIVLPKRRSVVFVHDCFWHGHDCDHGSVAAKFNAGSWAEKIAANRAHDQARQAELRSTGWQVETVWECQIDQPAVIGRLAAVLLRR